MTDTPTGPPLYLITDWDKHFECNRTRDLKNMQWIPLQNKHDGDGYTELLDHENGPLHFAAWVTLAQLASRCKPRGTLVRDRGRPYTFEAIARVTRIPAWVFEEAIPRLLDMGWVSIGGESEQECDNPAPIPHPAAGEGKGIEGKGIELDTPPNPRRGRKASRSMSLADKKKNRVEKNSALQIRVGAIMGRRAGTRWTLHLAELLEAIGMPHPEDIARIEYYYAMEIEDEKDHRRHSLETLLGNWDGECERSIKIVAKSKRKAAAIIKAASNSVGADGHEQALFDCVDELVEAMQKSGKESEAAKAAQFAIGVKHGAAFTIEVREMAKHRYEILEQQKGTYDG